MGEPLQLPENGLVGGATQLAGELRHFCLNLVARTNRRRDDDEQMLNAAHAARFFCAPATESRMAAELLLARVYLALERAESALHHANRCLEIGEEECLEGLPMAEAHAAVARAAALAGDARAVEHHYILAAAFGGQIVAEEQRRRFSYELIAEPWFGQRPATSHEWLSFTSSAQPAHASLPVLVAEPRH